MKLDGFYGDSNTAGMNNYRNLVVQLPNELRNPLEETLGMIAFLEYKYDITHLGATRRIILDVYINDVGIEFTMWINKTYDNISAVELIIRNSKKVVYEKFKNRKFLDVFQYLNEVVSGKELK